MKKYFIYLFLSVFLVIITGCGITRADDVIGTFEKKLNKINSYYIEGIMQIINNEDTYDYDVKVSYQKEDYYKIELTNTLNNHEQIILRNDEGVYVITPSLNKSFKFQSDWPYNNSQVYLLTSILEDLKEDEKRTYEQTDKGYIFTSTVNYPNNKDLSKQNIYIENDGKIKKVEVTDKDNNALIVMNYNKIEYDKKFDKNYFALNTILKPTEETQDKELNNNTTKEEKPTTKENNNTEEEKTTNQETNIPTEENNKTETTVSIEDVIYPMYLPENTYLTNQEKINTDTGERLILTFGGENSFTLVEETINKSSENIPIPVNGDFDFLTDVIGIIDTNSVMWHNNGIEYYMTSNTLPTSVLIDIARSISVLPVSK